ncbi:helix-turn-helix domain-containing protein [Albibacillus kandeliae]|mgnify:CR=1 FL=1|uniref:helix-turn-helix domain-containing protein n=1 Tax=Albibacillus kandeliae TaxID=2174228 RepID=UPI000D687257|nr:helix-turn-helix transcriptional regulator [Albibacillus kandeliae]
MADRTFAERLRAAIDADPKLTEAGLAVKAGLSNSVVRKILAGNTQNPRVDTARKICAALGTTLEEFMSNAQTEEEKEIVRLVARLPEHLRQQLLGYGRGLAASWDQAQPESDVDKE